VTCLPHPCRAQRGRSQRSITDSTRGERSPCESRELARSLRARSKDRLTARPVSGGQAPGRGR
jgi:hypothetical protein